MLTWKTSGAFKADTSDTWKQPTCQVFLSTVSITSAFRSNNPFPYANLEPNESPVPVVPEALSRGKLCVSKKAASLSLWILLPTPRHAPSSLRKQPDLLDTQTAEDTNWAREAVQETFHTIVLKRRQGRSTLFPSDLEGARTEGNEPTGFLFLWSLLQLIL